MKKENSQNIKLMAAAILLLLSIFIQNPAGASAQIAGQNQTSQPQDSSVLKIFKLCSDSDNGVVFSIKGQTKVYIGYYGIPYTYTDACYSNILLEYYCAGTNRLGLTTTRCAQGCSNGACLPKVCAPKWQVGQWSECANETQTRTVTDLNNCGKTDNKPKTAQTCTQSTKTYCAQLYDRIQASFQKRCGMEGYDPLADIDNTPGVIDFGDLSYYAPNQNNQAYCQQKLNRTTDPCAIIPADSANLITNPSLESSTGGTAPDSWFYSNWGTNSPSFVYPAPGRTGNSAQINMAGYVDGDAKWYFSDVQVTQGKEYKFSDYYKSDVPTRVTARFTLADNSYLYLDFGYSAASPQNWSQFSYEFMAPANAASLTIFHLIENSGFLSVDDFSLTDKKTNPPLGFSQGMISFNFDDGWLSTFQNALPILNNHNIKSTHYLFSQGLGEQGYITSQQMLKMQRQGHEIGAHSKTHSSLISLNSQQISDEALGSKNELEALGAATITSFAYPYGDWNQTVKQIAQNSGYKGARTAVLADGGFNAKNQDPYLLKTMSVEANTPIKTVKQWINQALADKTWLVLVFHQVENNGGQYSVTPQFLTQIADYVSQNNVKTVTTSQGLAEMGY